MGNTFEGCDDPNGATDSAWARWSRGWTAEENRHGDLLNRYLYLGGRCDEARHEKAYQLFVERVLELDPDGAIISYADMMKKQIVMPAELMCDGYENPQRMESGLYEDFG